MKKYDIFLVDADNTVLDFHASSRAALKAAFESFGKAWTEEYAKKFSAFNDSLWEMLERKELTREKLLDVFLFLKMLGMEDVSGESSTRNISAILRRILSIWRDRELLKAHNGAGRVYIVTNGILCAEIPFRYRAALELRRGSFRFEKRLDKLSYTDYVGPAFDFDKSRGMDRHSLTADIRAANAADIVSIWLNPGGRRGRQSLPRL
ncbi:MAG: HAD family hydrolase [Christensenellaceae bacterium]